MSDSSDSQPPNTHGAGLSPFEVALLKRGKGYVTRALDPSAVSDLIRRLHPVQSEGLALRRLGPEGDGGYLVPDDLEGIEACFSPGVAWRSGFEKDCADLGMQVFLADSTVAKPAESHERFHFTRKHVGAIQSDQFMTLDEWVASSGTSQDAELILQMDIEGGEYEALLSCSNSLLERMRILVVEFHELHQLWSAMFNRFAARVFDKLLQTHACVHLHPNNCSPISKRGGILIPWVMEFTFLRRDRLVRPTYATTFPHPLDRDNVSKRPSISLPPNWYGGDGDETGGWRAPEVKLVRN